MPPVPVPHCKNFAFPYSEPDDDFVRQCGDTKSQLYQCAGCGHMFFHPVPTMEELDRFYANEYTVHSEEHYRFEQEYARPGLLAVADHLIHQARYFGIEAPDLVMHDFGCAFGALVHALVQRGVDASGNEINSDWVRLGKTKLGDRITDQPFSAYFADSSRRPHLITFLHTLEHTPDPLDLLLDVRLKLDPKGILYIVVPNALFLPAERLGRKADENFLYPTHLHYFSPKSMQCLLRAAGFRLLHLETRATHFSPTGEEAFWQALLGRRTQDVFNKAELLTAAARNFQTAELFVIACLEGNDTTTGDPGLDQRLRTLAPCEQPLWRRVEVAVTRLAARHRIVVADGGRNLPAVRERSRPLAALEAEGRLTMVAAHEPLEPALAALKASPDYRLFILPGPNRTVETMREQAQQAGIAAEHVTVL